MVQMINQLKNHTAMKKLLYLALAATMAIMGGCAKKATSLEVSFDYQRMNGGGSNQFAVWIENDQEQVVKTLFVTHFTAMGRARGDEQLVRGYIKRPYCVPTWVQHVKANDLSDAQMDALSGATPAESGKMTYTWDLTGPDGKKVAPGTYKVYVQGTLHDPSIITFSGTFNLQKTGNVEFSSTLTEVDPNYGTDMITNVAATLK